MPEWDPEVEVDADRARSLIAAQFPELAGAEIAEMATGWDNVVFRVDERWVFRFPRREIAVAGVTREIEVLGRLSGHLPLPIPEPRWIGAPSDGYPWPWFGAPYLPGRELAETGLPDEERGPLASAVGRLLRALHAPMLRSRIGPDLPVDPMRRADMAFRVGATRRRLDALAGARLWTPTDAVGRLLDDAAELPPSPWTAVVHGDLHPRHLLVDDAGRPTGVIDWGDVCAGDPAIDLSVAFGSFAGASRGTLLEAYGRPLDGLTELRARVLAVFLAAALLAYADDRRQPALRAEALRALERAVA